MKTVLTIIIPVILGLGLVYGIKHGMAIVSMPSAFLIGFFGARGVRQTLK
jgi:hypothetical protein